jgi:hypothetical protein
MVLLKYTFIEHFTSLFKYTSSQKYKTLCCDQTAMGLPPITSAVSLVTNFWYNVGVSEDFEGRLVWKSEIPGSNPGNEKGFL